MKNNEQTSKMYTMHVNTIKKKPFVRPFCRGFAKIFSRIFISALAVVLAVSMLIMHIDVTTMTLSLPQAYAETEDIYAEPDELQLRIEESAAAHEEAVAHLAEIETQIEENEAKIAELEAELPAQRERASAAVGEHYLMLSTSNTYLEFIFGADTFGDFIANIEYVGRIEDSLLAETTRMTQMVEELEATRATLEADRTAAVEEKTRAAEALNDAQAARQEAQRRAYEQQQQDAASDSSNDTGGSDNGNTSGNQGSNPPVNPPAPGGEDWSQDKTSFVNQWAPRIDAYLAGYPLAGYGRVFAEAAWDYGVDPRWSPAISHTESTRGTYCYQPHNAWGWGGISYPDWETAIHAHVRGLARGYGYTISVEAAQKYCPPNWEHWYNVTSAQMGTI